MQQIQSPARIFLTFLLMLPVAMLLAAIASPWVQSLLSPIAIFPLHRVFSRLTMLGVIACTTWLLLRQGLAQRELLGFNRPWLQFVRRLLVGLLGGLALMTLALVPLFLLDIRIWSDRMPTAASGFLLLALKGLGSGLLVALIEETFFRGALQGALRRQGAMAWALFVVPAFYSVVHFLGRAANVPYEAVTAWSGFTAWQGFFTLLADPLRIADAFVALYCVGLLLALVRQRWGDLAGCIGLHAGFVAVIAVFRKISAPAPDSTWSFLVGDFDGLLGIWIAALTAIVCVIVARGGAWRSR
jgi:membrane protease YdiL (CAAX protease family)